MSMSADAGQVLQPSFPSLFKSIKFNVEIQSRNQKRKRNRNKPIELLANKPVMMINSLTI